MRLKNTIPVAVALISAAVVATIAATFAVSSIEERSQQDVARMMNLNGHDWTSVDVDGLQVILSGEAPDEATRFRALGAAGTVIDASRVIDMMDVTDAESIQPPRFSIEILSNEEGVSLIGLIPAATDREAMLEAIKNSSDGAPIADFLETADYPAPTGWEDAVSYSLTALAELDRSKISIAANRVELKAISDSRSEKRRLETELARQAPENLHVAIEITAPRPVVTPFTLRFLIDDDGARFDACSADTEEGRQHIIDAASAAGMAGKAECVLGLGVPSPEWDEAVALGITKLSEIGGGSITYSDADVTLVALESTPQAVFDAVVGELESTLPDVFSLHAILPEPAKIDGSGENDGPPEFVATRSPEGDVQLRGRISSERARVATESFARAQFGSGVVTGAMRLDEDLPGGWSSRVLTSLEAMAFLNSGSVTMQPGVVEIRGVTGDPDAKAEISRILSEKLGEAEDFRISVEYQKKLDPVLNLPTAEECVQQINLVLSVRQITFAPSSADIDDEARDTIDKIATIMKDCADFPMEIGGHTDSQGREIMNAALSQNRADAVLNALLARRVLTSNLTAKGYGEAVPVADNETEEGRELNRRIEFRLILPEEEVASDTATETVSDDANDDTPTENPDE